MIEFVHTHVHSEYSLLDGAMKVDGMVEKLKAMGHKAIAVTEHGNMYSLVKVNKKCRDAGIKHIIGCEFYVAPISMDDKTSKKGDSVYHHLIVLAKDKVGYSQLIQMCSLGFKQGFYYKPRIDEQLLFGVDGNHLIVTTACIGSRFAEHIMKNDDASCEDMIKRYAQRFGEDFYLEIQNHGLAPEAEVTAVYEWYGQKLGIPIIATSDTHYLNREDSFAHDIALCIGTGQNIVDERKFKFEGDGYWLLNGDEMVARFKPEYISNTNLIADKCDGDIMSYGKVRLPVYQVPDSDEGFGEWIQNERNISATAGR